MGFKVNNKKTEVTITNSDNPELIGQTGIIQRMSMGKKTCTLKLNSNGEVIEIPLKDLFIPKG